MFSKAAIYRGEVIHKRLRPVEHKLRYKVFSVAMDVDCIDQVAARLKLFSLNRFNLFGLRETAHGFRDGTTMSHFAWQQVRRAGMEAEVDRIVVLFYPQIFGFAFNPLTVYFCLGRDGQPVLMIYEVRNTFGEDLTYVLPAGPSHGETYSHTIDKRFYVSPFNNVDGNYTFHVRNCGDEMTVGVALKTDNMPLLRTHFRGQQTPLTDLALLKMIFAYPLMTIKVVAAIHWEALKIWKKGMRLKTRPPSPPSPIVYSDDIRLSV